MTLFHFTAAFQKQKEDIHLETCCVTGNAGRHLKLFFKNMLTAKPSSDESFSVVEMNDIVVNGTHRPVVYGIGK